MGIEDVGIGVVTAGIELEVDFSLVTLAFFEGPREPVDGRLEGVAAGIAEEGTSCVAAEDEEVRRERRERS
ncbi:hypothetical protein L6452_31812 [Arctium lappa]|uniref:Uncharacterized protein n=1 Tax=Arctium lappa TaxID=4217 RepID=A0ACB8Z383_ARCLA|nr:hypothetical protein L6452_31812 [Arctium lappa]